MKPVFKRRDFVNQVVGSSELTQMVTDYASLPVAPLATDDNVDTGYELIAPTVTSLILNGTTKSISTRSQIVLLHDAGTPRRILSYNAGADFYGSFTTTFTSQFEDFYIDAIYNAQDIQLWACNDGITNWGLLDSLGYMYTGGQFPNKVSTTDPAQKRYANQRTFGVSPVLSFRYYALLYSVSRSCIYVQNAPGERSVSSRVIATEADLVFAPCALPPAPATLRADPDNVTRLTEVHWDAVDGAQKYVVRRDGVKVAETTRLSWRDEFASASGIGGASALTPAHVYGVAAVNGCGEGPEGLAAGLETAAV